MATIVTLSAQAPTEEHPTFAVASVKPNKSGGGPMFMGFQPGGRFRATNASLRELVSLAFATAQPLPNFQIIGASGWTTSDRVDIDAKADESPTREIGREMLRTLLADRFKLVAHSEARTLPSFTLVVNRPDGRLGPQLTRTRVDCAALRAARGNAPPVPSPPPGPAERLPCGIAGGPNRIVGGDTMAQLVALLSRPVNQVVVDQTGLVGTFDVDLTWTPDQPPNFTLPDAPPSPPIDPNSPSIFTALQERLGLRLEPTKGPVNVIVIDHVEKPSED
jgi:uncharacterized protein (TIGR03435 family)